MELSCGLQNFALRYPFGRGGCRHASNGSFPAAFFYSLHNAGFCGVYYYISHQWPRLFRSFHNLVAAQKLPLHGGEPEVPYLQTLDRAIYGLFNVTDTYNYLEQHLGTDPAPYLAGTASWDYLRIKVPDLFMLVCELPYYTDPTLDDDTPAEMTRREAVLSGLEGSTRIAQLIAHHFSALEDHVPYQRLYRSVADYASKTSRRMEAQRQEAETPAYAVTATCAQAFDSTVCRPFYHSLYLGEVFRLANTAGEHARAAEIQDFLTEFMCTLTAESHFQVLPLKKLVTVQAGSGLLAMAMESQRQ